MARRATVKKAAPRKKTAKKAVAKRPRKKPVRKTAAKKPRKKTASRTLEGSLSLPEPQQPHAQDRCRQRGEHDEHDGGKGRVDKQRTDAFRPGLPTPSPRSRGEQQARGDDPDDRPEQAPRVRAPGEAEFVSYVL